MSETIWTPSRVAMLQKLADEGMKAKAIALKLGIGITKNMVIGKARRMGIVFNDRINWTPAQDEYIRAARGRGESSKQISRILPGEKRTPHAIRRRAERLGIKGACRANGAGWNASRIAAKAKRRVAANIIAAQNQGPCQCEKNGRTTPINEIKFGQCRWPLGNPLKPEFRWCGCEAQFGSSYCAHHLAQAYPAAAAARICAMQQPENREVA